MGRERVRFGNMGDTSRTQEIGEVAGSAHELTLDEKMANIELMKNFLETAFRMSDLKQIDLDEKNLGSNLEYGLVGSQLTHDKLVDFWGIAHTWGIDRSEMAGLSSHKDWQELCKASTPTKDSSVGWSTQNASSGNVG